MAVKTNDEIKIKDVVDYVYNNLSVTQISNDILWCGTTFFDDDGEIECDSYNKYTLGFNPGGVLGSDKIGYNPDDYNTYFSEPGTGKAFDTKVGGGFDKKNDKYGRENDEINASDIVNAISEIVSQLARYRPFKSFRIVKKALKITTIDENKKESVTYDEEDESDELVGAGFTFLPEWSDPYQTFKLVKPGKSSSAIEKRQGGKILFSRKNTLAFLNSIANDNNIKRNEEISAANFDQYINDLYTAWLDFISDNYIVYTEIICYKTKCHETVDNCYIKRSRSRR